MADNNVQADGEQHFFDVPRWNSRFTQINAFDIQKVNAVMNQGVTPPCTSGEPIDTLFRISYRRRTDAEVQQLVDVLACAQKGFVCLPSDRDVYDMRGIPLGH